MKLPLNISLKFDRKDFEEIYFSHNQGNYFKDEIIKKFFENVLIAGILLIFILYYSLTENSGYSFLIVVGLIFIYNFVRYIIKTLKLKNRNRLIKNYLNGVELIKSHNLRLTNDSFEIIQDNQSYRENWTDFKSVDLNTTFILLYSVKENYLFPKKSMLDAEFDSLTEIQNEKIK